MIFPHTQVSFALNFLAFKFPFFKFSNTHYSGFKISDFHISSTEISGIPYVPRHEWEIPKQKKAFFMALNWPFSNEGFFGLLGISIHRIPEISVLEM